MKFTRSPLAASLMAIALGVAFVAPTTASAQARPAAGKALQGQVVKMAWIDPLSGLMGPVGNNQLKSWQFMVEKFNANNPAGVKFEVVGMDNKLSPTESLNALKSAIDQGIRYVIQGNGSSVALALVDAINKHNERNPGKEVIYLNEAAVDPDLTNSKCSFWHFRFDADTTMKLEAMTSFMKDQQDIKKVYLLNQNYSHGQQVAKYTKEYLKRKRPDIEIVGEDLHPLAQVRDFAPYIAKIKASGADSVVTGNWGSDLSLLVKAAVESGYNGKFFTYYTGVTGTPSALGTNGAGKVYQVSYAHPNMQGQWAAWTKEFKQKYNDDFYTGSIIRILEGLTNAMAQTQSTDPVKVATAMSGMKYKSSFGGDVEIRKTDHQLQQPLYMMVWQKADAKYPYSPENTGMTLAPVAEYPNYVSSTPTSCQMKRPGA
ncbi:branched-chain amino acid ABC transporter substrate-binding protein [Piscinibacter koreensis]|uniref:Branched-chain amino acid ABC transporter substrate-binding protein n=1 Tax=Piscinibacter koreensis TaxID=2742824 RepID=A0A7Y6NRV9_9BURK|nr:branched-chain amino acid ABC transporter substrate-binding protein [Schlegelella koreensis]NUZ08217.1 branched-chain amino acid ABC transporter substrate-binding protein [Schlegelella koreensis]